MKKHFIIFAALLTLIIPAVCAATSPRSGPYVSGFIGASVTQNANVTGVDNVTNTAFDERDEFDPGINIGGTGGFDFGIIRLEGELSYKHAEFSTITDQVSGQRYRNVDGNLGALAMMFNGFIDLHNASPITPYLGGGIGFATLHLSDTFATLNGSRIFLYERDDNTVFAYQAGAGLEVALNRMLSLDFGYRYFATSNARFGSDRDITTELKFQSHNAAAGMRVKF